MAQKASPSFQAVDMLVTLTPGYLVRMIIGGHIGYMRLIVTMIFGGDGGFDDDGDHEIGMFEGQLLVSYCCASKVLYYSA